MWLQLTIQVLVYHILKYWPTLLLGNTFRVKLVKAWLRFQNNHNGSKRIAHYTIQVVLNKQMLTGVQENIDFVRS